MSRTARRPRRVLVPTALIIATAWLYLYVPEAQAKANVALAAQIVSAAFIIWGLIGKSHAEDHRSGQPAAQAL